MNPNPIILLYQPEDGLMPVPADGFFSVASVISVAKGLQNNA